MKNMNLSIIATKIKRIVIFLLIFVTASDTGMAAIYPETESIRDTFYQSVNYNPWKDLLIFTIPEKIPEGHRFYLHVSGRMYIDNKLNVMSFHAFDEESQSFSWKLGETYTYPLRSENLVECLLVFGLIDKNNRELLYEIYILPNGTKNIKIGN